MLTSWEKYLGVRYATDDEIAAFKKVDAIMNDLDDAVFASALDIISNYVFAYGADRRALYGKTRRLANKLGVTVPELCNWYYVEA